VWGGVCECERSDPDQVQNPSGSATLVVMAAPASLQGSDIAFAPKVNCQHRPGAATLQPAAVKAPSGCAAVTPLSASRHWLKLSFLSWITSRCASSSSCVPVHYSMPLPPRWKWTMCQWRGTPCCVTCLAHSGTIRYIRLEVHTELRRAQPILHGSDLSEKKVHSSSKSELFFMKK
jgi:hypothetical protein